MHSSVPCLIYLTSFNLYRFTPCSLQDTWSSAKICCLLLFYCIASTSHKSWDGLSLGKYLLKLLHFGGFCFLCFSFFVLWQFIGCCVFILPPPLSNHPPADLSVCMSVCLYVYLSVCLSVRLYVCRPLVFGLSVKKVSLSLCLSVCLSVCQSVCQSVCTQWVSQPVILLVSQSVSQLASQLVSQLVLTLSWMCSIDRVDSQGQSVVHLICTKLWVKCFLTLQPVGAWWNPFRDIVALWGQWLVMLGVLAIYVVVTFAVEMSGCPRWVYSLTFFRLQCICVPCSILPWILCGLSLMSVHFKGFSPGTPVISTSQKPASANSNSTRVGPTWKPKSRYFNFTRKKLQSLPLAVGTPSLLRAKTHDFFTFQKNTNRSKKKTSLPPGNVERKWSYFED